MSKKRKNTRKTRNVLRSERSNRTFNPFSSNRKKRKTRNSSGSKKNNVTDLSDFIDTSEIGNSTKIEKVKIDYRFYIALFYLVLILISLMYISTTTEARIIENTQKQKSREKLEFVRIFYNNQLMQLKTRSGIYEVVRDNGLDTYNEPPKVIKGKELVHEAE